jgi:hypothetical protein
LLPKNLIAGTPRAGFSDERWFRRHLLSHNLMHAKSRNGDHHLTAEWWFLCFCCLSRKKKDRSEDSYSRSGEEKGPAWEIRRR